MTEAATRMAPDSTRPYITQSAFYSPAFNGAIFDGPLRLYFSQSQEAMALKFYFELRSRSTANVWPRSDGANVFVMLYPSEEIFDLCFTSQGLAMESSTAGVSVRRPPTGRLGRDLVIALQVADLDLDLEATVDQVVGLVSALAKNQTVPNPKTAEIG